MKLSASRLTSACAAALFAALYLTPFAHGPARAQAGGEAAGGPAASGLVLNLRDFGAVGDGETDDGPALQSALDALALAGGGTLHVPAGHYAIVTPTHKDFTGLASSVTIEGVPSDYVVDPHHPQPTELARGMRLVSEFLPRTGTNGAVLSVAGLQSFLVKDLAFMGTPSVHIDAHITVGVDRVEAATVRHCEFYGLVTQRSGGAIIRAVRSGLHIDQTKFLGSVGNSGVYVPVVENIIWKSVKLTDVIFLDYGLRRELLSKTGYAAPFSWVNVGNAAAVTPDSPRREVSVNRAFLDEGGTIGLTSLPGRFQPPSAPIDLYYITGLRMNVSNLMTSGHYLESLKGILVEDSRYGWSRRTDSAIRVLKSGHAILDRIHTEAEATRLRADSATKRLTVINSVYEELASAAQTTRVINVAPEDDPVLHIRQRFNAALARNPDPAAHFYWSERFLECADADAACIGEKRALLDAYLASAPAAVFDLSGRVTDETGAGIPGVSVALKGGQNVTALTDDAGNYRFRNLPTSGAYTVTASKRYHTFDTPTQTFTTPEGDRTADFSGVLSRHAISGRLLDNVGAALADTPVVLGGGADAATNTDATGRYSFAGLADGLSYTVTPSRLGHSFNPGFKTVGELSANVSLNFIGTPGAHAISGRATTAGPTPAPLAGVTVTLSGSQGATTTTDPDGNYSFPNLPAGGNYAVSADHGRFGLTPVSKSFTNLAANQTADFSASPIVNHALAASGAVVSASSTIDAGRSALAVINGDRKGLHWGSDPSTGSGWHDATADAYPDWVEITFPGPRTLREVSVYGVQDDFRRPLEPTEAMTFTKFGVTGFQVEYWTGSEWATVPDGLVVSTDRVWSRLSFAPLTTTQIRVLVNSAVDGRSRLTEVEAWGPPAPPPINYALAANGATATASSTVDAGRAAAAAINGDRRGLHWGSDPSTGSGWHDATADAYPDWLEVSFGEPRIINVVNVFGVQDAFRKPAEPGLQTTSTLYTLVDFQAQYWDGAAWVTLPNGDVTGNDRVWRRIAFPAVTTQKVRVLVSNALNRHSRVVEIEAWGAPPVNHAAAANGATASASSSFDAARGPEGTIDGDRRGLNWGAGGGWHDATAHAFPDWLQVNFAGPRTVHEVHVFSLQDTPSSPAEPTPQMTFSQYGATAVHVEYWTGAAWAAVPGGSATNSLVWKRITFSPVTTDKLRVVVDSALAGHSRLVEVEAY